MKHERSVPLPPYMAKELQNVKTISLMGLLTEAGLAWLTVDDKLFLWPYAVQDAREGPSFISFQAPNGQCVLSVGLATPPKGLFRPFIKWCLVVTTADEVRLCALAYGSDPNVAPNTGSSATSSNNNNSLRLFTTNFSVPTDGVRMLSVCGTKEGRIFLGGEDGCLYEVAFADNLAAKQRRAASFATVSVDDRLEQFYNTTQTVPATLREGNSKGYSDWVVSGSKRVLSAVFFGADSSNQRPQKCRKFNRSSKAPVLATSLLPDFLLKAGSFVLGGGTKSSKDGGRIEKMVVDEERGCLYTLGSKGWICSFYLRTPPVGTNGSIGDTGVTLAAVMNTPAVARTYLDAVSQQRMTPPNRSIIFPGGGSAAQKGVGGMEGARSIVSLAKTAVNGGTANGNNGNAQQNVLTPISLHVIPRKESGKITLVAITKGGLRFYISSLADSTFNSYGGRSKSSETKAMLAPSNRLLFCHIRAPPPLTDEGRSEDFSASLEPDDGFPVGGFAPKMSNKRAPTTTVDSSFYGMGAMVLAVGNNTNNQTARGSMNNSASQQSTNVVGDHIVATAPDFVFRKGSKTAGGERAPGGVTETLSLPLSSASSIDNAPVLPGGVVSDMAHSSKETSSAKSNILKLMLNSQTPTDAELSVGLIPEFIPSWTVPATSRTATNGRSHGTVVASRGPSFSSTALAVTMNMIPNLLFSRPLIRGIQIQKPRSEVRRVPTAVKRYRISQRFGAAGFSLSAADISANKKETSTTRKSARLNPWLLRPSVAPLNQLTLQHLLPPSQMVAMNSGGLQYFQFTTVLADFAEALTAAGENVDNDERVSSFFRSYGHAEGCAMCVLLATNQGPSDVNVNRNVKSLAARAALARAYMPTLSPIVQGNDGLVTDPSSGADPLLPPGYAFRSSALLDGVVKVVARLLRPVWHKPLVVVTEGRTLVFQWKSQNQVTPAKVELLLDDETVGEILSSLSMLVALMKDLFKKAIDTRPGASRQETQMMDIDRDDGQHLYITDGLKHQSHLRDSNGAGTGQLAPAEAERIAILTEERKIHSLFRLVSRVHQLLRLVSLLAKAQNRPGLPEVEWGNLHGLTVSQLVQTSDGQDRLEKTLNSLVTSSSDASQGFFTPSTEADELAKDFAKDCYLFFSPGAHFAYLGFSYGSRALSSQPGSARRTDLAMNANRCFRRAAPHWHKTSLVASRSIQTKGQTGYEEAAKAAMRNGSPVAKAAAMLVQLGDVECAVEICLTTASNFNATKPRKFLEDQTLPQGTLPWEHQLYHKRHDLREPSKNMNTIGSSIPTSPSANTLAMGTNVTANDAIMTCWSLIFSHLMTLLQSDATRPLGERMVSECAGETDKAFLREFFQHMLSSGNTSTLLRVESAALELWLKDDADDKDLLPSYYVHQGRFYDAGRVYADRAKDNGTLLDLPKRIEYLSQASNMFNSALKQPAQQNGWGTQPQSSWDGTQANLNEARELLDIAKIQSRLVEALPKSKVDPSDLQQLRTKLETVSSLYATAAHWSNPDLCLLMLHSCKSDDQPAIQSNWKSFICETIFPSSSRNADCYSYLCELQQEFSSDDLVTLITGNAKPGTPVFENGDWAQQLEMKIVSLGRDMYGSGADFVFPAYYILNQLEELRKVCIEANPAQASLLEPGWPLKIIANVGVPFMSVLNLFERMADETQGGLLGGGGDQRKEQLAAIVSLLDSWVSAASQVSSEQASHQLLQAIHSAQLVDKIRRWKHEMEGLGDSSNDLSLLENRITAILRQPSH